jgi:putative flippase GtrA
MRTLIGQFARFGAIGAIGLVIDAGLFNLLRLTVFDTNQVHSGAVWAKVISTSVAIIFNWLGNRYWTFRNERRRHPVREGIEFVAVSLGGLIIGLGCLWLSHYVLGFTSLLADNIASNVVGLALGTIFRFALYRLWVFSPSRATVAIPGDSVERSARTQDVASDRAASDLGAAETPV